MLDAKLLLWEGCTASAAQVYMELIGAEAEHAYMPALK